MSTLGERSTDSFVLPSTVVTRGDVSHLVAELERLDSLFTAAAVRAKLNAVEETTPVMSTQLNDFLSQNDLKLEDAHDRSELITHLRQLKEKVPVIHMTFAVTVDLESRQKLAEWVRSSVHPQAVLEFGLQPSLVAGVYVRTTNHVLDLSLRGKLGEYHDQLVKQVEGLVSPAAESTAAGAEKTAPAEEPA